MRPLLRRADLFALFARRAEAELARSGGGAGACAAAEYWRSSHTLPRREQARQRGLGLEHSGMKPYVEQVGGARRDGICTPWAQQTAQACGTPVCINYAVN